jgi:hypothetical protein
MSAADGTGQDFSADFEEIAGSAAGGTAGSAAGTAGATGNAAGGAVSGAVGNATGGATGSTAGAGTGTGAAAGTAAGTGATVGTGAATGTGATVGTGAAAGSAGGGAAPSPAIIISKVDYEDFIVYGPSRMCIYMPCRTPWPIATVDEWLPWKEVLDASGNPVRDKKGKIKLQRPTAWLAKNRRAAAMSWAPGKPEFIHDLLPVDSGWVTKTGAVTFNNYRPPIHQSGDAKRAKRWVDHWHALFPADEAEHCIDFLSHLVQHPEIKINHCVVIIGEPKIGKDTLLEPMETAVGAGNYKEITLSNLISKNNEFLRAVFVLLSEARDMGEQGRIDRYGLYDHTKNLLATPPNMLRINEKYIREYYITNCFGMAVTSNHRDAFYLTPDDRRYYIVVSECKTGTYDAAFWNVWWHW